jgi:small subunit ribosomal protein S17
MASDKDKDKDKKAKAAPKKEAAAPKSKAPAAGGKGKPVKAAAVGSRAEARAQDAASPEAAQRRASIAPTAVFKSHGFRRKMVGVVTSDRMDKTVTVEVVRRQLDPVYKKYVRERARYKAHDEQNQYKIGDHVEITENAPISREKRWMVTRLVARRVEA